MQMQAASLQQRAAPAALAPPSVPAALAPPNATPAPAALAPPSAPATPVPAPPPTAPAPPPRRGLMVLSAKLAIVALAAAMALLLAGSWDNWVGARLDQATDDAYVRGDITPLSAKIEGHIRTVAVGDFQHVKAGDLLVTIEDADFRARRAQAAADLAAAEAAIETLKAQRVRQHARIAEAESGIHATMADVDRTQLESARQQTLLQTAYGTPQRVERAVADQKRFQAALLRNRAEVDGQRRELAMLDAHEAQLHAAVAAKRAMLDLADITLGYTRITAPLDGVVGERKVRAGQYVRPGAQVISVVPLEGVWVVANYKETQLTRVRVGQRASVRVDSLPDVVVDGRVESIAPASGAQFSLLPPDNATGNFTKVVQRIPVKIVLDAGHPLSGQLRPGMSVIATVHTGTGHTGATP